MCIYPVDGEAEITKTPNSPPTFIIGDGVSLKCSVKNVSTAIIWQVKYKWFRKGSGPGGTEQELAKSKQTIELPRLTLNDKGTYRCEVTCDILGVEWNIKSGSVTVDIERELNSA